MTSSVTNAGRWIDLLGTAFADDSADFPAEAVALALTESLDARAVSFNWANARGAGCRHWPPTVPPEVVDEYVEGPALFQDPLVLWFERTGDLDPQTSDRVPVTWFDRRLHDRWRDVMRAYGVERRLALPMTVSGHRRHLAFVVARDGADFTDAELGLARRLQPLLVALARQTAVLQRLEIPGAAEGILTGRELSILVLLSQGLTAAAMAHRLAISERTVQKHLQHLYAKLGVSDRLVAVSRARRLGLLPAAANRTPGVPRAG